MSFEVEVTHQVVELPEASPAEVYAKLASFTPGRPSFLFESLASDTDEGRFSVVGYRPLRGEGMPPNADAVRAWFEALDADGPEELAEAITQGIIGYAPACAASREHGLLLYPDEFHGSTFTRGSTVMVFDHQEKRAVVAGPVAGRAVERLIWELGRGPDIAEPLALADTAAEAKEMIGQDKLSARSKRAVGFIADELEEVVLAETLLVHAGRAEPLDVYRCWREHTDKAAGFFLDMGAPPPQGEQLAIFGFSSVPLCVTRGSDNGADAVLKQLPHRRMSGVPNILAAKVARRLEENSRGLWGGIVGYVGNGRGAGLYLAEDLILFEAGTFWLTEGARIHADTDPTATLAQVYAQLQVPLRAIEAARINAPPESTPEAGADDGAADAPQDPTPAAES